MIFQKYFLPYAFSEQNVFKFSKHKFAIRAHLLFRLLTGPVNKLRPFPLYIVICTKKSVLQFLFHTALNGNIRDFEIIESGAIRTLVVLVVVRVIEIFLNYIKATQSKK